MFNLRLWRRVVVMAALAAALPSAALETGQSGTFFSAADLAAHLKMTAPGMHLFQVPNAAGDRILVVRREATGEVEVHEQLNDIMLVQGGKGTVTVGGEVTGNHQTEPNEWRGGTISGGHEYRLAPGDLLLIPAGAPHLVTVTAGPFSYVTIKTARATTNR